MTARQERLIEGLELAAMTGIEVGALDKPVVTPDMGRVIYVDYADTATLRTTYAADAAVDVDGIVEVEAIWRGNTLEEAVGGHVAADYIVASHVIEHVPDLITWLQELSSVLRPGGEIRLAIPDKRYCFDILRQETRLADVLAAYLNRPRTPQPHEILDCTLHMAMVDVVDAWNDTVDVSALERPFTFDNAMALASDAMANGSYHDVHCWVFTPSSFAAMMEVLSGRGLIDLGCRTIRCTTYGELEFFVALRRMADPTERQASWEEATRAMALAPSAEQRKLSDLEDSIADLEDCIAELTSKLEDSQALVEAYRTSEWWQLTAPLRAFVTALRGWAGQGPAQETMTVAQRPAGSPQN